MPKRKDSDTRTKRKKANLPRQARKPGGHTTGRRGLLTPEVAKDIITLINGGNYDVTACDYVGIHTTTFYGWLQRGENEAERLMELENKAHAEGKEIELVPEVMEEPYLEFFYAVKKARAHSEATAVQIVKGHMGRNWQAAMTFLERRFKDRWRRHDKVDMKNVLTLEEIVGESMQDNPMKPTTKEE